MGKSDNPKNPRPAAGPANRAGADIDVDCGERLHSTLCDVKAWLWLARTRLANSKGGDRIEAHDTLLPLGASMQPASGLGCSSK